MFSPPPKRKNSLKAHKHTHTDPLQALMLATCRRVRLHTHYDISLPVFTDGGQQMSFLQGCFTMPSCLANLRLL